MEYLSIWDLVDSNLLFEMASGDLAEYLNKKSEGSLMRLRERRESKFLDSFLSHEYASPDKLYEAVVRKVGTILKDCKPDDLTPITNLVLPELLSQITINSDLADTDRGIAEYTIKSKNLIGINIGSKNYVGCLDKKLRTGWDAARGRRFRYAREFTYFIDLQRLFAELIIISEVRKYYEDRIKNLNADECIENKVFFKSLEREICATGNESEGKTVRIASAGLESLAREIFRKFYADFGVDVDEQEKYVRQEMSYKTFMFLGCGWQDFFVLPKNSVPLHIFWDILSEYGVERRREKYLNDMRTEYARSYEPLSGMPQKYSDAANSSLFKRFFGTVEYDFDTDLKKMDVIGKEFLAIMSFFNGLDLKDFSLRFRKLGHHKASGVYFPNAKCMCVDVRMPSSFIHELFHLCDFKYGELSLKARFAPVEDLYGYKIKKFVSTLPKDSALKKRLSGKTKYNLDYYLEPTEIFARCGEIYAEKVLGLNNTLNKAACDSWEYLTDEEMMSEIKKYFDYFFSDIVGENVNVIHVAKDCAAAGI